MGYGTKPTPPKGVTSSDKTGDKMAKMVNGVAMGKADAHRGNIGMKEQGEMNTGRQDSECYSHERAEYK
jgi:hypothetical protein